MVAEAQSAAPPPRPKAAKSAPGSNMIFTLLLAIAFAVFAGTVIFQFVWRDQAEPEPVPAEAGSK